MVILTWIAYVSGSIAAAIVAVYGLYRVCRWVRE